MGHVCFSKTSRAFLQSLTLLLPLRLILTGEPVVANICPTVCVCTPLTRGGHFKKYSFTIFDRGLINSPGFAEVCCNLWNPSSKKRLHVQVHEGGVVHAERGVVRLAALVHLLMVAQVGLAGKALVALQAGERLLFGVDASVTDELGGHAERLSALHTLVAFGLRVDAAVVLQGHQVGELFLAHRAEEEASLVAVLVVQQGAGVTVCAATVLADVALFFCVCTGVTVRIRNALWNMRQRGRSPPGPPIHPHDLIYC